MARSRMILISLAALVLSIGGFFLAHGMASPRRPPPAAAAAPAPRPTTQVLVAAHDLAVGDRLDEKAYDWRAWPVESVSAEYTTSGGATVAPITPNAKVVAAAVDAAGAAKDVMTGAAAGPAASLNGAVVREAIHRGEPISKLKIVLAGAGGVLAVTLDPGMRAMSIPLSTENAAGGFIQPGDHVDVVQTRKVDITNPNPQFVANTVMRNVRVMAIDQATRADAKAAATAGAATATLEVTQAQAEQIVLARAQAQGQLTLVLRSYADAAGSPREGASLAMEAPVVHVYRNGVSVDVKVAR